MKKYIIKNKANGSVIGTFDSKEESFKCIIKSAIAFYKLSIIAKAWNKIDGFVPDFSKVNQVKYYPWFVYKSTHAGFVYANTDNTALYANANIGSRLCFKSASTAQKFGDTFTALYNEMFL